MRKFNPFPHDQNLMHFEHSTLHENRVSLICRSTNLKAGNTLISTLHSMIFQIRNISAPPSNGNLQPLPIRRSKYSRVFIITRELNGIGPPFKTILVYMSAIRKHKIKHFIKNCNPTEQSRVKIGSKKTRSLNS